MSADRRVFVTIVIILLVVCIQVFLSFNTAHPAKMDASAEVVTTTVSLQR